MQVESKTEVGIKYKVIKLNENEYFLLPIELVEGYGVGNTFYGDQVYSVVQSKDELELNEYVIDSIHNIADLQDIYEYYDTDFVKEYFLSEEQDYFWYLEMTNGELKRHKIKVETLKKNKRIETYQSSQDEPIVTLNYGNLVSLLGIKDLTSLRNELERLKNSLSHFKQIKESDGVSKIVVENGQIVKIETEGRIIDSPVPNVSPSQNSTCAERMTDSSISVIGLEKYISERVFGHDDEIRQIATKIIMNYYSTPEFGVEPILIVGPTGTGKTETIKAASEYLNVPFVEINTPDLVPQGIRGASLESYLNSLKMLCGGDLEKAQRAFVYLDEFDKLGQSDLDIKESVKEILLKFIEGGPFVVDDRNKNYVFDTTMLNKICSGAFSKLFEETKAIGFGSTSQSELKFDRRKISETDYYGKELVSRIPYVIPYYSLSREKQKEAILYAKISKYLQKKNRYKKEFGIDLILQDDFINGILDQLAQRDNSMRDLNNLILNYLSLPEYEILSHPKSYKRLVLTKDTLEDPSRFDIS